MNIILKQFEYKNENRTYKALEDGFYNGVVKDVCITTSKNNREMIVVTIELQGEKMLNGAHLGGRIERLYIMLNDEYTPVKLFSFLQACNIDVKVGDAVNIEQLIASNILINKNVVVKLKKTSYINKNNEVVECNNISYIKASEVKQQSAFINNNVVEHILDSEDIPF